MKTNQEPAQRQQPQPVKPQPVAWQDAVRLPLFRAQLEATKVTKPGCDLFASRLIK